MLDIDFSARIRAIRSTYTDIAAVLDLPRFAATAPAATAVGLQDR